MISIEKCNLCKFREMVAAKRVFEFLGEYIILVYSYNIQQKFKHLWGGDKMYFYCEKCKKPYPLNTHSYICECGGMLPA